MKEKDTHSYRGWLNSDNFVKRAFAVLGYSWIAMLIIYGGLIVLIFLFYLLTSFFS
ncbi:MAG: hypothetical protein Q8P15_00675 [Nanoarchaeota archaeon]|nr:hypothetical protein [Nanoarchaeota archaeon]